MKFPTICAIIAVLSIAASADEKAHCWVSP